MHDALEVRVLTEVEDFERLRASWNDLAESTTTRSIYVTWEWLFTWWEQFGAKRQLFILAVFDNDELVGLAPLLRRNVRYWGVLRAVRLEFLGTGEAQQDEVCSYYMDFLARPERRDAVLKALAAALTGQCRDSWDEVLLKGVPAASEATSLLLKQFEADSAHSVQVTAHATAYVDLTRITDGYVESLGPRTRRNIRRDRRRLAATGELSYQLFEGPDAIPQFKEFVRIHRCRWSGRERDDAFSSDRFVRFHEAVMERLAPLGRVQIGFLRHNNEIIAGSYHFPFEKTLFAYQIGVNDGIDKKSSVGKLEFCESIENAVSRGFEEYDMYLTDAGSYKNRLAKNERSIRDIRISQKGFRESVLSTTAWLKERIPGQLRG